MKSNLQTIGIGLITLGFTLSIFDFLLDNSPLVLGVGLAILIVSYFVRR
ncbi:MAG: hypothetical protein HN591_07210 [Flavobacteriales bacterium]|nr:hypothetical protein [Flavobacteriales bacterium]MBT7656433.1 hypothetical protein [Flavobacteriales bacterium]